MMFIELENEDIVNVTGGAFGGALAGAILGGAAGLVTGAVKGAITGNLTGNELWKYYTTGALAGTAIGLATPV